MSCPENGTWFKKGVKEPNVGKEYKLTYDGTNKGSFYCEYGDDKTKYYFYVKGKGEYKTVRFLMMCSLCFLSLLSFHLFNC